MTFLELNSLSWLTNCVDCCLVEVCDAVKLIILGQVHVQVRCVTKIVHLWQFSWLFECLWFGVIIITVTSVSINLIISTMPFGFDCLRLLWPLVSNVIVLGHESQVVINITAMITSDSRFQNIVTCMDTENFPASSSSSLIFSELLLTMMFPVYLTVTQWTMFSGWLIYICMVASSDKA